MDFTLNTYSALLKVLLREYKFLTFSNFIENKTVNSSSNDNVVILRHDVDRLPQNSLTTAKIENELGIKGTYYFRIVPESFDKEIIKQIAKLGHEIGYHYEDIDLTIRNRKSAVGSPQSKTKNNKNFKESQSTSNHQLPSHIVDSAYELFKVNLETMREIADIKTICMHGSPLSKFDNKLLWEKYDYRKLGIIGEPYLDIKWNEFGYLTDTGRRWDGISVRDKVKRITPSIINEKFKSTYDIIDNIEKLPPKLMITVHPERWTDNLFSWSKQIVLQNVKNIVKRFIVKV